MNSDLDRLFEALNRARPSRILVEADEDDAGWGEMKASRGEVHKEISRHKDKEQGHAVRRMSDMAHQQTIHAASLDSPAAHRIAARTHSRLVSAANRLGLKQTAIHHELMVHAHNDAAHAHKSTPTRTSGSLKAPPKTDPVNPARERDGKQPVAAAVNARGSRKRSGGV